MAGDRIRLGGITPSAGRTGRRDASPVTNREIDEIWPRVPVGLGSKYDLEPGAPGSRIFWANRGSMPLAAPSSLPYRVWSIVGGEGPGARFAHLLD